MSCLHNDTLYCLYEVPREIGAGIHLAGGAHPHGSEVAGHSAPAASGAGARAGPCGGSGQGSCPLDSDCCVQAGGASRLPRGPLAVLPREVTVWQS